MQNINVVVITGNLTRDPELHHTSGGTPVCEMRVAVNGRRKNSGGAWIDKANYFDVTVFGPRGEACAEYLAKGRPVAVDGRLDWSEWEAKDGSGKRQAVKIIANSVQFLGDGKKEEADRGSSQEESADRFGGEREPVGVGAGGQDDDISF